MTGKEGKTMRLLKASLGYAWAVLMLVIVLATFMGLESWARGFASITGVKVSPKYTGGEVARNLTDTEMNTMIHYPVFARLVGESSEGFVQVDWESADGKKSLPPIIDQEIDCDADGAADFHVRFDTAQRSAVVTPLRPDVLGLNAVFNFSDTHRAVRVSLRNTKKD